MLHLILIPVVAVATALSATQTASGQQLTEGYSATTTALPAGAGQALTTSNGVVYFDGFDLSYAIPNSTPQTLLAFPALTFGSFTIPVGATKVLFGESSNGGIWSVPLNGQPPLQIANVPLNYDAVMLDDDRALISAKTGGFAAADNDLIFVDLVTGQTQLLAQFPGASGPLAIDDADNVYYATAPSAFPAPAGTVSVLRLTNATINNALATNQVLGVANAEVIIVGLDAAGDIAFDDDGDLFFVDWYSNLIGEINDATGNAASLAPTLFDYGGLGLYGSVLQFVKETASPSVLEPFQPPSGRFLIYETDYSSVSQVRSVTAQRAEMTSSVANPIPSGNFTLSTNHGPRNGIGVLAFATAAPAGPVTTLLPGFEQPLHLDSTLGGAPVLVPVTFDATGQTAWTINNPGFSFGLSATAQTVALSVNGGISSSDALSLQIAQ
jgi:hypothetical protein